MAFTPVPDGPVYVSTAVLDMSARLALQGVVPGIERHGSDPCNGCAYQLRHPKGLFCHVCGMYPARTV